MHKGTGGLQHHMSILRNGIIACLCRSSSSMSHDEFKKRLCPLSIHFYPSCRMSLSPMSHVDFKNCSCRPVEAGRTFNYHNKAIVLQWIPNFE